MLNNKIFTMLSQNQRTFLLKKIDNYESKNSSPISILRCFNGMHSIDKNLKLYCASLCESHNLQKEYFEIMNNLCIGPECFKTILNVFSKHHIPNTILSKIFDYIY